MNDNYTIEPASIKDIPFLVSLINSAYRGEESKKGWTTEAFLIEGDVRIDEDSLRAIIEKADADILVYKNQESTIEGSVYLHKKESKLYLGMLSVNPELQAKGIGKKLLYFAEKYALEKKCTDIFMNVISLRSELIAWYERHGYVYLNERSPFPSDKRFGLASIPLEFMIFEKKIIP